MLYPDIIMEVTVTEMISVAKESVGVPRDSKFATVRWIGKL